MDFMMSSCIEPKMLFWRAVTTAKPLPLQDGYDRPIEI